MEIDCFLSKSVKSCHFKKCLNKQLQESLKTWFSVNMASYFIHYDQIHHPKELLTQEAN